ncbi:MAG: hypothetical protein V1860_01840 [bacterium]
MQIIYIIAFYLITCKILPYFLYPNYFKKSKVENYDKLKKLSAKLKASNKTHTIKNVYDYITNTYSGDTQKFKIKNLRTILFFGDFSTTDILDKKQFLWCHNQNRLFKSILINTGLFKEEEIIIKKRLFMSFFIHQWLYFKLEDKEIIADPFYKIFKVSY